MIEDEQSLFESQLRSQLHRRFDEADVPRRLRLLAASPPTMSETGRGKFTSIVRTRRFLVPAAASATVVVAILAVGLIAVGGPSASAPLTQRAVSAATSALVNQSSIHTQATVVTGTNGSLVTLSSISTYPPHTVQGPVRCGDDIGASGAAITQGLSVMLTAGPLGTWVLTWRNGSRVTVPLPGPNAVQWVISSPKGSAIALSVLDASAVGSIPITLGAGQSRNMTYNTLPEFWNCSSGAVDQRFRAPGRYSLTLFASLKAGGASNFSIRSDSAGIEVASDGAIKGA